MKIQTRKFGEIEIDENKIITIPEGLPGFPGYERFALLEDPNTVPFCWLQSQHEPDLALLVMKPFVFKPDYKVDLDAVIQMQGWKEASREDLSVYVVINISNRQENKEITANLIGPIVINTKKKEGVQVVLSDTTYSHKHNVLESA